MSEQLITFNFQCRPFDNAPKRLPMELGNPKATHFANTHAETWVCLREFWVKCKTIFFVAVNCCSCCGARVACLTLKTAFDFHTSHSNSNSNVYQNFAVATLLLLNLSCEKLDPNAVSFYLSVCCLLSQYWYLMVCFVISMLLGSTLTTEPT